MKIRRAKKDDALKISNLQKETLDKVNRNIDNEKVVNYLIKTNSKKYILEKLKNREVYCLINKNKLLGIVDIEKNKIGGLFVKKEFLKRGFGSKLLKFAEDKIKSKGYKYSFLYPTKYAKKIYEKKGYIIKKKSYWKTKDFKVLTYLMEKKLK